MKENWLEALNEEIRELKQLTLETRKMAIAAEKTAIAAEKTAMAAEETARAAQQQTIDTRFLLEKHIQWHDKPLWKRWFGVG